MRAWAVKNRVSENAKNRAKYATDPERRRRLKLYNENAILRKKYGLTTEKYAAMLASQGGRCAICRGHHAHGRRDAKRFTVDHCHVTGAVRGLLCMKCNTGIGMLGDDPGRLRVAIAYLEKCKP